MESRVCTRFAPEPSGFLHIGHVKAALLSESLARQHNGKFILRFDDTNPSKEKVEFADSIMHDLKTLDIKVDEVTYASDYFDELLAMAEQLVRQGKAYVDDTCKDAMQAERKLGLESRCRGQSVEENLALWGEMLQGTPRGEKCCLRGKLDMQAANKTLRDPVYYRFNSVPHQRTGSRFRVYPTYDLACPFMDSIQGVTHALRSSEYHDRDEQYYRILLDLGLRRVQVRDFSRLNLVYTLLSKRKLQWFVDTGLVDGWDDPRLPTVQGLLRRGLTVGALRSFILLQGASKNVNLMEWDKLWSMNKQMIDPVCPRHTAVLCQGKALLTLRDGPVDPFTRELQRHKKFPGAGTKVTSYCKSLWIDASDASAISEGEEVTLMDWGNAVVERIHKDDESGRVSALSGRLHLDGSVKATKLKLTWLAASDVDGGVTKLTLVEFGHLITKRKVEETDELAQLVNPVSKKEVEAIGDSNMRKLHKGEIIQLERKGYYICDVPFTTASAPVVLINIPDGRRSK